MAIKLNIGAGSTKLDGWISIDRDLGLEAYPLPDHVNVDSGTVELTNDSVDEIRASHILEHFTFADAQKALAEWVRVLKPGGKIRISVPDVDKVLAAKGDKHRLFYLMGGQEDENDFHKSAYDECRLSGVMAKAGLTGIVHWTSENTDCASMPISLNLEGTKTAPQSVTVKVAAYMTLPRYIAAAPRSIIDQALKPFQIGLTTAQGVFYGQCMQRMFEKAIDDGIDWILALDADSLFNDKQLSALMDEFARLPAADAMASLQCRRGRGFPLLTVGTTEGKAAEHVDIDGKPFPVATAHFGMTLIRVDSLKDVPKPWFKSEPESGGTWGDERLDDDIWFWHQWRLAGKTIYCAPRVSIGHMDEMVSVFDDKLQPRFMYISDWRSRFVEGINEVN